MTLDFQSATTVLFTLSCLRCLNDRVPRDDLFDDVTAANN